MNLNQRQVGADPVAQNADDRFLFDTVDTALWFDVTRNAAGGLTMIADQQASITFGGFDLFLI